MAVLWQYMPNAADAIVEEYGYATSVIPAYKGREQRIRLKRYPGGSVEFSVLYSDLQEAQRAQIIMERFRADQWEVPLWHHGTPLTAAALTGATTLYANTLDVPLADPAHYSALALLWFSNSTWELVTLSAIYATHVEVVSPITHDWPEGSWLLPIRFARLDSAFDASWHTSSVLEARMRFELEGYSRGYSVPVYGEEEAGQYAVLGGGVQPLVLSDSPPSWPTHVGYAVLDTAPDGGVARRHTTDREIALVGSPVGKIEGDDHSGISSVLREHWWPSTSAADFRKVKAFLDQQVGRLRAFWLPSYNEDLSLFADYSAGTTVIQVKYVGYVSLLYPGSGARRHLAFTRVGGGAQFYATVKSATSNPITGTETLTIEPGLEQAVTRDGWMVSYLRLGRLEEDRLALQFDGRSYAGTTLRVRELPWEAPT